LCEACLDDEQTSAIARHFPKRTWEIKMSLVCLFDQQVDLVCKITTRCHDRLDASDIFGKEAADIVVVRALH
jgi:hypothetical protein